MNLYHMDLGDMTGHAAGRMLLYKAYRRETGTGLKQEICIAEGGKPYLPDSPWKFSISHTKHHAFLVFGQEEVGVDAEELDRNINLALADKILSPSERAQFDAAQDKHRALLTFWVLKEAQAKLTGLGLRGYPNNTNFSLDDPRVREWSGCLVAVLTKNDKEQENAV